MTLIKCSDLAFAYEGRTVLQDLSFEVAQGDYLCVVGENGAGKSTLMKGLLGLKRPTAGSLEYAEGLKATEIGYLPQQTPVQKDFPASVYEVVLSGCLNHLGRRPFFGRAEKKLALETMERLEIKELKNRCYRDLSGGQQQRVLLARAMCATHKLILLDEPAAGLDPMVTQELYDLVGELNRQGITVIMVSHDIERVLKYANKVLHLHADGYFFGTTPDYERSEIGQCFCGGRCCDV